MGMVLQLPDFGECCYYFGLPQDGIRCGGTTMTIMTVQVDDSVIV